MAKRRRFTPEFKAELVFEVLSGVSSQSSTSPMQTASEPVRSFTEQQNSK